MKNLNINVLLFVGGFFSFFYLAFIFSYSTTYNLKKTKASESLYFDFTNDINADNENSDFLDDFNDDIVGISCLNRSSISFSAITSEDVKTAVVYFISRVFYDIPVQPPEALIG